VMRLARGKIMKVYALSAMALVLAFASCKREERGFRVSPPAARTIGTITLSELQPGSKAPPVQVKNEYEENAYALSEGKRLFDAFNCSGCHFHGGGGIGPPLMDDEWIYGSEPANIFATILEGRPNGMPSFRGKIPDYQVWQLAAYVRSMSGLVPSLAAPGRSDHMQATPPEQSKKPEQPKESSTPKSAERP
jgi:cytochrome c oxidase cbb3-type subunit III